MALALVVEGMAMAAPAEAPASLPIPRCNALMMAYLLLLEAVGGAGAEAVVQMAVKCGVDVAAEATAGAKAAGQVVAVNVGGMVLLLVGPRSSMEVVAVEKWPSECTLSSRRPNVFHHQVVCSINPCHIERNTCDVMHVFRPASLFAPPPASLF